MTNRPAAAPAPELVAEPSAPELAPADAAAALAAVSETEGPLALAPPDEDGALAVVLEHGGQVRRFASAEARKLLDADPPAARRATLRDLAIAGVA